MQGSAWRLALPAIITARVVALLLSSLAVYPIANELDNLLSSLLSWLGVRPASTTILLVLVLAGLLGRYTLLLTITGLLAVIGAALGAGSDYLTVVAIVSSLVASMVERRLEVMRGSGVRVNRSCTLTCYVASAAYYLLVILALLGVTALGGSIGWAIGSALSRAGQLPGPLGVLSTLLLDFIAVRVVLMVLTVWILHTILTRLAEPLLFALLASRDAVAQHLWSVVEAERRLIIEKKAWHHRLYVSVLSHVVGFLAFLTIYAVLRTVAEILLLYNESGAAYMLLEYWPIVSLAGYYATYRFMRRRITRSLFEPRVSPPILYAVLGVVAALLLVASGVLWEQLASLAECIAGGVCSPPPDRGFARLVDEALLSLFDVLAASVEDAARTINALVAMLFGNGS